MILDTPPVSGTFDSLRGDLEDILTTQGLYRDEAHAMLETWGDSWFEEGSRLIYIVPRSYLDSILPLSISPLPLDSRGSSSAASSSSRRPPKSPSRRPSPLRAATIEKYGRFLYPIFDIIAPRSPVPTVRPPGRCT